jgi:tetratricopeptide (TPR) repeat protein
VLAAIPEKPLLLPLEFVETTPAEKPPAAMRAPAPSVEPSPPEDVLEDVVSIEVFEEVAPAEAAGGGAALPHLLELKDLDPTSSRPSGLEMEIALLEAEDLGPPLHAEPEESGVLVVPETLGISTPFVASLPAGEQEYDAFGAELYFQEGQTLLRQNAFSGAVAAFGRAVEAYPDQPDYHAFLGWAMFLHKGRGEAGALAARPHLKQAFRIAPDSAQAHELAGWVERDARNHLKAVEYLTRALALGAPRLDLFQTVKEIFEHLELYDELEQQYRQLIFRLREKEPLKTVPLWVDLAYLYLRRFGRADQAKVALQVAVKLAPNDPRVKAALQALGESTSQEWPQVAEGHRQRWRTSPNDLTPLHGLVAMHLAGNRPDHALTAASILGYLGAANESEQRFLRQLKPKGLLQTARPLESAQLKILRLPEDDENVESLMAHLSPLLSTHYPMVPEALGSGEDKQLEEDSLPARFTSAARYAARRLGTSLPPLYVSTTLGLEAMPFAEERERIAVGQELLDSTDEARIAFALARALSCLPRGRRHLFSRPVAELKEPVLATLALFRTSIGSSDTTSDRIAGWQEALRGLLATTSPLEELIGLLLKDPKINLSAWRRAVRRTSARAALLVGADLGAALQAVAGEADIQQDLMDFVLGETYAELRRALSCSAAV